MITEARPGGGVLIGNTIVFANPEDAAAFVASLDFTGVAQPASAVLTALAAGSQYVKFIGPTTSVRVFTLPDADSTLATTAYADAAAASAAAAIVNSAPGALDTLKELADSLADDANFAATMTTALAGKQALSSILTAVAAGTWTGATSITTLGTITAGTWHGTAIDDAHIASAAAWSAKQDALPSQSGQSGKYLTTNGSALSWATVSGGGGATIASTTNLLIGDGAGNAADAGFAASQVALLGSGDYFYSVHIVQEAVAGSRCLLIEGTTAGASAPVIDATQDWNAGAVAFTFIRGNVTNTASDPTSKLIDLQVGGTTKFAVDVAGVITGDGSALTNLPGSSSVPVGAVIPFAGAAAPSGWLLCDGSPVSRTTYADLFGAIGETYGAGDGSTTFALPDLRGRVPAGADAGAGRLTGATLAAALGDETYALTTAELASHHHTGGTHTHSYTKPAGTLTALGAAAQSGSDVPGAFTVDTTTDSTSTDGAVDTTDTGSGDPHPNVQPTLVLSYIIKF